MAQVVVETAGWIRADPEPETVEVRLRYESDDPFAVSVCIRRGGVDEVWVLARDLFADGLRSMVPLGEGQIQVQATSVLTEISRTGDDGSLTVLRLPWWNTREFVRLAQAEVPRGGEQCDVDSWVAALTAQEP